jgi:folate-dependent phosphoribosylglycinamide formyltransferase PurN
MTGAKKKVIIIAPSPYSLYSTAVYSLLERKGVHVAGVIIKKFTPSRFLSEYKRDGKRLLSKIWKKLVLKEKAYSGGGVYNIVNFRNDNNIALRSLKEVNPDVCQVKHVADINSEEVISFISSIKPDLIVFTGGGLVSQKVIEKAGLGVLNCHIGVLPEFRGMDVVEWPVLVGKPEEVGFTVHLMDKGVDTGDILAVKRMGVGKSRSFKELRQSFEPMMCSFITDVARQYLQGSISPVKQHPSDGRQYFILEPRLYRKAESLLATHI